MAVTGADALLGIVKQKQDLQGYRERHWTGTLEDHAPPRRVENDKDGEATTVFERPMIASPSPLASRARPTVP